MTISEFQGQYRFLSNFYVGEPLYANGMRFQTSEHLYQAFKSTIREEVLQVLNAPTPGAAKRMGANLTLRDDWDKIKDRAMEICIGLKFTANPDLTRQLLATGNEFLVEGNSWHDNYWGACVCQKCQGLDQHNKLGYTLMRYRDSVRRWNEIDI